MKKSYLIFAVFGLITLVAVLTNPNQERHKEVIKNKLNVYMQKSMKENLTQSNNEWEQAGQALGMMFGGALVDRIIDNLVSTDNYVLFSITKITSDGQTNVIGVGAFGNVFITGELEDALNEGLLENQ